MDNPTTKFSLSINSSSNEVQDVGFTTYLIGGLMANSPSIDMNSG